MRILVFSLVFGFISAINAQLPVHCAAALCARPDCDNPIVPKGECCPVCTGRPCYYKGVFRKDGDRFKDDCNTCTCNNGHVSCTEMACGGERPGRCPPLRPGTVGICVSLCFGDDSCRDNQKCCSNGCGHVCMNPVFGSICNNVVCPQLRCVNQYTPPGRCCPVCKPPGKPDCSSVFCAQVFCEGQYTPPDKCCPVCPTIGYGRRQ